MYSGKIAVPPGGGGLREINSFFVVGHCSKKMLVIKANSWLCILATLKIRL
jgi:hypothetical protein